MMSSQDLADTIRMIAPFHAALSAITEKVEEFSSLDSSITDATKQLAKLKDELARTKAETDIQLKLAADAKDAAKRQTEESNRQIANDRAAHTDAMSSARQKAEADAEAVRVAASSSATLKLKQAQEQEAQIINEANAEAEEIKNKHATLIAAIPKLQADHDEAKRLLAEIDAKIDARRGT